MRTCVYNMKFLSVVLSGALPIDLYNNTDFINPCSSIADIQKLDPPIEAKDNFQIFHFLWHISYKNDSSLTFIFLKVSNEKVIFCSTFQCNLFNI